MKLSTVVLMVGLLAGAVVPTPSAAQSASTVLLSDVLHTVDGSTLVISGWVHNRGVRPLSGLIVDASGFTPSGDPVTFGSDGIPWEIPAGGVERFSVILPIGDRLVRDYAVTVAAIRIPRRPLAIIRRSVDVALYRPLVLSRIQLFAAVMVGQLVLRTDVDGMPVEQVTVEATLILREPKVNLLQTLTVTLRPDTSEAFAIGGRRAVLVALRVVDFVLKTAWD